MESIDRQSPLESSAPDPEGSGEVEEQYSEVIDEVEVKEQDDLEDLESCPSGSIG